MKKYVSIIFILSIIYACGGSSNQSDSNTPPPKSMVNKPKADDGKGVGPFTSIELNDPLNQEMIANGKAIYDMKCSACHRLTGTRVVGPGFKGVTERRKPEWIMNMITNTDVMLEKDPNAQKLLEECLTRMPNQNVEKEDARTVLEFLLNNDKA